MADQHSGRRKRKFEVAFKERTILDGSKKKKQQTPIDDKRKSEREELTMARDIISNLPADIVWKEIVPKAPLEFACVKKWRSRAIDLFHTDNRLLFNYRNGCAYTDIYIHFLSVSVEFKDIITFRKILPLYRTMDIPIWCLPDVVTKWCIKQDKVDFLQPLGKQITFNMKDREPFNEKYWECTLRMANDMGALSIVNWITSYGTISNLIKCISNDSI
jgi:hypothetical protein